MPHKVLGTVPWTSKALGGLTMMLLLLIIIRVVAQYLIHGGCSLGASLYFCSSSSLFPCARSRNSLPIPHSWHSAQGHRFWRLFVFNSLFWYFLAVWPWGNLLYFSFPFIKWNDDNNSTCLTEVVIRINWNNLCKVLMTVHKCLLLLFSLFS